MADNNGLTVREIRERLRGPEGKSNTALLRIAEELVARVPPTSHDLIPQVRERLLQLATVMDELQL